MIIASNITGIIADDLTGANDTALQFHLHGANTQILLNCEVEPLNIKGTQTWALSTESRNETPEEAYHCVKKATQIILITVPKNEAPVAQNIACPALPFKAKG